MSQQSPDARWWEREPLLIYEVSMNTAPGRSVGSGWQARSDPAEEVEIVAASGALQTHLLSVIEGHLTNRFCYFRSRRFHESRYDYLGAYLAKSRARGYRTIVYFNVHAVKPEFGAEHPEWRQIRDDGKAIDDLYGIETSFCVNSPWRDWVRDVCVELCAYPIDGIFFDGPCLFARACYCEHCRRLYRERYGGELPPKQPGQPELRHLAELQSSSLASFLEHARSAIRERRDDVLLYCNAGPREEPYYVVGRNNRVLIGSQDVLGAEGGFVYGELTQRAPWRIGSNAKYYQTQSGGKPTVVFTSPAHGPWRSSYLGAAELELAVAQAPLHGSGAWFSGFSWFRRQSAFDRVAELYRFFGRERSSYFGTRSLARVAIVWPEDSVNFYGKPQVLVGDFTQQAETGETAGDITEEFEGLYAALVLNQIPCDVIDEQSVRGSSLAGYDLVILPNVACTGSVFDEKLRAYVRDGGNVVASFESSLCDEGGRRGTELGLSDLLGVRMRRSPLKPYPHFYFMRLPDADESVFAGVEPELLPAPLVSCEVESAEARALSPYSVKFRGWDGSEIVPSAHPAVTIRSFGKGRAVYLAGTFGAHYWRYRQPDIRRILGNLYRSLAPARVLVENAPETVEVIHRAAGKGEVVSLVNYSGGPSRPFERIRQLGSVRLRLRSEARRARALRLQAELPVRLQDGWAEVTIPELGVFESVVFE